MTQRSLEDDFLDIRYVVANELDKLKLIESLPIISEKKNELERFMWASFLNSYLMDFQDYYEKRKRKGVEINEY